MLNLALAGTQSDISDALSLKGGDAGDSSEAAPNARPSFANRSLVHARWRGNQDLSTRRRSTISRGPKFCANIDLS